MLMRPQQVRFSVPVLDGSAAHCPFDFARYSWIGLYFPYCPIMCWTMSSTGSSWPA